MELKALEISTFRKDRGKDEFYCQAIGTIGENETFETDGELSKSFNPLIEDHFRKPNVRQNEQMFYYGEHIRRKYSSQVALMFETPIEKDSKEFKEIFLRFVDEALRKDVGSPLPDELKKKFLGNNIFKIKSKINDRGITISRFANRDTWDYMIPGYDHIIYKLEIYDSSGADKPIVNKDKNPAPPDYLQIPKKIQPLGGTFADAFPPNVGDFRLRGREKGAPMIDDLRNAQEVANAAYFDGKNNKLKVTAGRFATKADAEAELKGKLWAYSGKDKSRAGEIQTVADKSGQEVGLTASVKARGNAAIFWTSGNNFYLVFGPDAAAEKFFKAFDTPLVK